MRILVTGGTSFVGAPLVRWLVADGHKVRVLSRHGREIWHRRLTHVECEVVRGDICNPHSVSRAAFGCESVIHLAYAPVSAEPREIMDVAVTGMTNVLRACELYDIHDLMLVSSPRAGNGTYYGTGKLTSELMAEAYLRAGALDRVITARVFNAYGPDMGTDHVIPQLILKMLMPKPGEMFVRVKGSGRDRRSFVWTSDCTEQLATLYRRGSSGCYDVGASQNELAIGDLAELIIEMTGYTQKVVIPDSPCTAATVVVPQLCEMLAMLPQHDLTEGLAQTVDWYKDHQKEFK